MLKVYLVLLSFLGSLLCPFILWRLIQAMRHKSWSTTIGCISRADLVRKKKQNKAVIEYFYSVDNSRYVSDQVGGVLTDTEQIRKYTKGMAVQVYYNPRRPASSVLEHVPIDATMITLSVLSVVCLGTMIGLVLSEDQREWVLWAIPVGLAYVAIKYVLEEYLHIQI